MEKKELEVRRLVFEAELKHVLFPATETSAAGKKKRKIDIDEFKMTYEKDYEMLRNILQDEQLDVKFTNLRNQVHEYLRKLNKAETKEQLNELEREIAQECPLINYSQVFSDKDAFISLGKRTAAQQVQQAEEEEKALPSKRQKVESVVELAESSVQEGEESSSSSDNEEEEEGESSSSDSSSSDGESGSQSDSSEESKSERGLA